MANLTMSYETVLIFNMKLGDDSVAALSEKFQSLIRENSTVDAVEEWGKRKLAYPIQDETEGYYLFVAFTGGTEFPAELDRICKITDGVLRSLIIRKDQQN